MQRKTGQTETATDNAAVKNFANLNKIKKAATVSLLLLMALTCIVAAYMIQGQKSTTTRSKHPGYICYTDNENNTIITGIYNNLSLTLEENKEVSNIRLNERETEVFYIARDKESSVLCSRRLSSLIYDKETISEDAVSYAISSDGEKVVYLTSKSELFLADTSYKEHKSISANVSEFYISNDSEIIVYSAKDSNHKNNIYIYSNGESKLVAEGAKLINTSKDLSYLLAVCGSELIKYDTESGNANIISANFRELVNDCGDVIYFIESGENQKQSLACFDQVSKVLSDRIDKIIYTTDSSIIVYTEKNEDGETAYKLTLGTDRTIDLEGSDLYNFMYNEQDKKLFYIDASRDQTMLISATLNKDAQPSFTAVDSEVYLLCGIISGKPAYLKNFNPITNMADMYFNSTAIRRNISINKYSPPPEHIPPVKSFTSVFNGIVSELYACYSSSDLSAITYCAGGKLYSFNGRDEHEIFTTELEKAYPISYDTFVITNDGKLTVIVGGKLKKEYDAAHKFLYVKHFSE